jgi:hypothetical protein
MPLELSRSVLTQLLCQFHGTGLLAFLDKTRPRHRTRSTSEDSGPGTAFRRGQGTAGVSSVRSVPFRFRNLSFPRMNSPD